MRRPQLPRPSAPIVVSSLALVVALSGSGAAIAAVSLAPGSVGKAEIATGAVGKAEIRNNAVGKGEIKKGAVAKGEIRKDAVGKSELIEGSIGLDQLEKDLLPDGVEAYATVNSSGTGVAGLVGTAKGITGVTRPASEDTGVYCITVADGVPVANNHAQATVNLTESTGADLLVHVAATSTLCAQNQFEVRTYDISGAGTATLTNDASFNVLVP